MYQVLFTGFRTEDEAKTFVEWFSEEGEQDIDVWLYARRINGEIDCERITTDVMSTFPLKTGDDEKTFRCVLRVE